MLKAVVVGGSAVRARQIASALATLATTRRDDGAQLGDAVVVWLDPAQRRQPFSPDACNVADIALMQPALGGPARRAAWRQEIARSCVGADLVLVGLESEAGLWSPALAEAGVGARVVVFAPGAAAVPGGCGLSVNLGPESPPEVQTALAHAAAWAVQHNWALVAGADAQGAAGLLALRHARSLPGVGIAPHAAPPGAIVLDLRPGTPEDRLHIPPSIRTALQAGRPVLTIVPGILAQHLETYGAGRFASPDGIASALSALATQGDTEAAARRLAQTLYPETVLASAIRHALALRTAQDAAWLAPHAHEAPLGADGQVLVLSAEHDILIDVRIHAPLGALHRRGAIAGYTIVRDGVVTFCTQAPGAQRKPYSAVIVHRGFTPALMLLLRALRLPFIYDLDDNLLASPQYRERFGDQSREAVRTLLQQAAVLSCSTARLGQLLQARGGIRLADKTIVTPNLATHSAVPRAAGTPRAVIWASSDLPALTAARPLVEAAVRDFCMAHRIKLVCLGAAPGPGLDGAAIEHVGLLPRHAYLDYIRDLSPAILVCPLETNADAETQDFVDGKSDVKMLDAAATGLVGVYSDAAPYRDTNLPGAIVCPNTYEGWLGGLEAAYRACTAGSAAPDLPPARTAQQGLRPWATALARARLAEPLLLSKLLASYQALEDRRRTLLEPGQLDSEHYLDTHPDVAVAVATGLIGSAYDHYVSFGFYEKRDARAITTAGGAGAMWWDDVMMVINRLQRQTRVRQAAIDRLQVNQAIRAQLRS